MSDTLVDKNLTGEVHSVFNKTMNIISYDKEIYTFATEEVFNGPQIIKVKKDSFNENEKLIGKNVYVQNQQLVVADEIIIDLEGIEIIESPTIVSEITEIEKITQLKEEIDSFLKERLDTVGFYRKTFPNEVENTIHQFLITRSQMLVRAFKEKNLLLMEESVKKLLGLGHGLTPSGDDFLTGFSLIINSSQIIDINQKKEFNDILLKQMGATNIISQNQLILSIKEQALKPVIDFINNLYLNKDLVELKKQADKVLLIGSSSGSDILYGVFRGLEVKWSELN